MSAQSIIHNTDSKIAIQINDYLKKAGMKYLLNARFEVGEGVCMTDIRNICRLSRIFCESSCEMDQESIDKVKEKINTLLIFNIPEL